MISLEAATEQCCGKMETCGLQLRESQAKLTKRKKSLTSAVNLLEVIEELYSPSLANY